MTNPTTPFNWQMPTASDLVTDLPADFETFGQAVATSMADLLGGTTGQVLSKASNTDMDFNWVAQDDSNAIQNAIVDAKGDLIGATAADTPARLAVGNNGENLVADSSASTGLRWQGDFAAGKNKIINGDMRVWQRGTSFTAFGYTADRWLVDYNGTSATNTVSQQTFTSGTAPVSGYEGTFFLRFACSVAGTGNTYKTLNQRIEDVRVFAGQTVTVSFWAKASATTTINNIYLAQVFGTGGSGDVNTNVASTTTLTTSWQRFSYSVANPSISGKTIGTNSWLGLQFNLPTNATFTVDFWGVQLEAGSVATAFQTATGTIQGELAACQRYFNSMDCSLNANAFLGTGVFTSTTNLRALVPLAVTLRGNPSVSFSAGNTFLAQDGGNYTGSAVAADQLSVNNVGVNLTVSGATAYRAGILLGATTAGKISISAEL